MLNEKLKSFGLIEAMLASLIVILILSAAAAIASSSLRNMLTSDAYREAEHISEKIMSKVETLKTAGQLDFTNNLTFSNLNTLPVGCFDTAAYFKPSSTSCQGALGAILPYRETGSTTLNTDGFVSKKSESDNFSDGYFSFRVKVILPKDSSNDVVPSGATGKDYCRETTIPGDQCRFVEVDVKWRESSGEKNYSQTEYFTNWEK